MLRIGKVKKKTTKKTVHSTKNVAGRKIATYKPED